jgi:hypothetical protein
VHRATFSEGEGRLQSSLSNGRRQIWHIGLLYPSEPHDNPKNDDAGLSITSISTKLTLQYIEQNGNTMRRALVGYSTPIGYDYQSPAVKDDQGRPKQANPVVVGSMGLMLLYDEIWFAEEWLCPLSMRQLPYCRFLNREKPELTKLAQKVPNIERNPDFQFPNLDDVAQEGYGGFIEGYYGTSIGVDNHSFTGNPTPENLLRDLELVDQCIDLKFDLAMNNLTHKFLFPEGLEYLQARTHLDMLELAENALNVVSMYDITGISGPYHPVIELMRQSNFLSNFRNWANKQTSNLHNQPADEILEELDARVSEFASGALSAAVGADGIKETILDMAQNVALDLVPGATTVHTILGLVGAAKEQSDRRLSAFIADGRSSIHIEQRKAERKKRQVRT